jgi:cation/acetate symporter
MAAAAILSEDVVHGLPDETVADTARIATTRIALLGVGFVTVWLAIAAPADPLQMFLWAINLIASAGFPVLVLSIWWKRINVWGALAGMLAGFGVAAFAMLLAEVGALGVPSGLAGVFGLPAGVAATLIVSSMTPLPAKSELDLVGDMRIPGGETILDREVRLMRLKSRATA